MPALSDLLSWLDNKRRVVGRNMSDLVTDPSGYLSMTAANTPQTIAEQGAGMAPMGLAGTMMYRGLRKPYDPNYPNHLEWWSEGKDLARRYGSNVMEKDITPKAPIDLGFRTFETETQFKDVMDRLRRGIKDRFLSGGIDKDTAASLIDRSYKAQQTGEGFKPVHEWLMSSPEAASVLKDAGYDSIYHVEQGTPTYGLLKRPLKDLLYPRTD